MARISSSEKPLAIRSITVACRSPARNACIAATMSSAYCPRTGGTVAFGPRGPWQPEQAVAPGGATACALAEDTAAMTTAASARRRTADQALRRSALVSGPERMRLPVAAKIALSTAGAATKMVGSPTPPQKPPDGITIDSTAGISSMRRIW
jgi:hypothetical protein